MKVPDLVLTNFSESLKLELRGLASIVVLSMEVNLFKSALNSLSFICSVVMILFSEWPVVCLEMLLVDSRFNEVSDTYRHFLLNREI